MGFAECIQDETALPLVSEPFKKKKDFAWDILLLPFVLDFRPGPYSRPGNIVKEQRYITFVDGQSLLAFLSVASHFFKNLLLSKLHLWSQPLKSVLSSNHVVRPEFSRCWVAFLATLSLYSPSVKLHCFMLLPTAKFNLESRMP